MRPHPQAVPTRKRAPSGSFRDRSRGSGCYQDAPDVTPNHNKSAGGDLFKIAHPGRISTASADRHRKSTTHPSSRDLAAARGAAVPPIPRRGPPSPPTRFSAKRPPGPQYSSGGPGTGYVNTGAIHRLRCSPCRHLRKFVCIELNKMSEIAGSKAAARPESSSRSAAKRWWRRASWPDDSRLRGPATCPNRFSSGGRPAAEFKIYGDGVQPGAVARRSSLVRSLSIA
jgi:hypothetical protein